jgi:two-component system sensor histidine kinase KdpD
VRTSVAHRARPQGWVRVDVAGRFLAAAAGGPLLVSALALMPAVGITTAALGYVLAVAVAAAVGGWSAGGTAAVLSFLGLNFFFTQPTHILNLEKPEDVVALAAFLLVATVVGSIVSRALADRRRAERRAEEARLLHRVAMRLLSGEPIESVLRSFAEAVTDLFELDRSEIRVDGLPPVRVEVRTPAAETPAGTIRMVAGSRAVGVIEVVPSAGRPLSDEERQVLEVFAAGMGLALEGLRLRDEVARVERVAEVDRARSALFSSVTHDLRTPLASILASATSMLDPDSNLRRADRRELLENVRQEAERLNRLVGNLLELSRLRAGVLVPTRTPASMQEVIDDVLVRLRRSLTEHRIRLDVAADLPDVPMDVVQVDQALTNLLENAVRAAPAGTTVVVSAHRDDDGIVVAVEDQGPGVPVGDRERLFEAFVRGDRTPWAGSGLGLAIARAVVEAHGGRIWIDDAGLGGAAVRFELPLHRGAGEATG